MPTVKQKKLAKLRIENPDVGKCALVDKGGYGPSVVKTPAKALESQGYKDALAEYGLTEELISTSLVHDIKAKPKKRERELRLGADILGMNKRQDDSGTKVIIVNISNQIANKYGFTPPETSVDR